VAVLSEKAASACVRPALRTETVQAALQVVAGQSLTTALVSAQVITLTEGVMKVMLFSKLKTVFVLILAVALSAGTAGLTYQAAAASPQQAAQPPEPAAVPARPARAQNRAANELEELRLEVAALRKGLETLRERVRTLEAQGVAPRGNTGSSSAAPANLAANNIFQSPQLDLKAGQPGEQRPGWISQGKIELKLDNTRADPLTEAEMLLRKLRDHPGDKETTDALERVFQRLKEQAKPQTQDKGN